MMTAAAALDIISKAHPHVARKYAALNWTLAAGRTAGETAFTADLPDGDRAHIKTYRAGPAFLIVYGPDGWQRQIYRSDSNQSTEAFQPDQELEKD